MVAAQNATQRSLAGSQEPQSATETSFSRDQIAQNLLSKDPSWFRQTADRGQGSAAYRKNQVEDDERSDVDSSRAQLPGMSESARDRSPSVASNSTTTSANRGSLASPMPLQPPRFDGPGEEALPEDGPAKTASGGTSPVRASSPTKGMGGFVQSAMMKRSDSVKRWSVTSPPGMARADSVSSNRSSRPISFARQDSRTPGSSRPTSQQGDRDSGEDTTPKASGTAPTLDTKVKEREGTGSIPTSPSKTMDPRRWSPTKSSWLDNALNKPESPKPQTSPHSPAMPAWRAELNKNKASNASQHGRAESSSHKHQVSIGGLMRSTPMGAGVKSNTTDLGGIYSPPARGNRPSLGHGMKSSFSKGNLDEPIDPEVKDEEAESTDGKPEEPEEPAPEQVAEPQQPSKSTVGPAPATKPKPATPPKQDFRSNLRQRPTDEGPAKANEPEFKNALGNLRRTKTQNYVAPDVFKNNILRGKAGLSVTGGPVKSERKDEFKDAILKKKDDFKKAQDEGKGVTRSANSTSNDPLPEGLARAAKLGNSAVPKRDATSGSQAPTLPRKPSSPKPTPGPKTTSSPPITSPKPTPVDSQSAKSPPPPDTKPTRVSTESDVSSPRTMPRALPTLTKETSAPSKLQQGRVGGGKLADRFNPALAGILARGPPGMATDSGKGSTSPSGGGSTDLDEKPAAGPQLTHMTKGRARGPRRKAPTASAASQPSASSPTNAEPAKQPEARALPKPPAKSSPMSPPPAEKTAESPRAAGTSQGAGDDPVPLSIQQQVAARAASRGRPLPSRGGTMESGDGAATEQSRSLPLRSRPTSPEKSTFEPTSPIKPHKTGGDVSQPGSPRKLDTKRMSKFLDDSSIDSSKAEATPEPLRLSPQKTGSRSPVRPARPLPDPHASPTKASAEPFVAANSPALRSGGGSNKSPPPAPKPSFDFLSKGSGPGTPGSQSRSPTRPLPVPSADGARSPPPVDSPSRSPTKPASDLSTLLTDFFGSDRPKRDYKVDPAELLASRPEPLGKVKTLSCQMFQITGDGKKVPVQAYYEKTLFEQEMYICNHKFQTEAGWKTLNVYFWVGDDVPEATAEDAQLFAQREAKFQGGNLVKMPQGRETSEFLQALGGAVVCRRGSSNKFDSLASSMLCGRRHLGEVVFDEIDFDPLNLCTGFPYLLSDGGKCHLWKGKGSNIDEISCAKLIGLDLSLTGELIEHEEGEEPVSFWSMFSSKAKPHSAGHWKLKPNYAKYGSRLFCSDANSRQQVSLAHLDI